MGIALRPSLKEFAIVDTYYARAKREPTRRGDLEIARTEAFKPNFLDLVRMLVAKQQSHVVIVSHGWDDGLHLQLTEKTANQANNDALTELSELVDQWPKLDAALVKRYTTRYAVTETDVRALVQNCDKIRRHESNCLAVHIRGCNIGKETENLETIRYLFNSVVVSAPECPMLYTSFSPNWHPKGLDADKWKADNKADTRRREFHMSGAGLKRLVLDLNYGGTTSSSQGVIERNGDLPGFAETVYGNKSHGVQQSMTIAALWPYDSSTYHLPHDKAYVETLNAVRVS